MIPEEDYQKFMVEVGKIHQRISDHYMEEEKFKDEIRKKLNPMFDVFSSVKNFNGVTVWILKSLILFGAGLGVMYGAIKWFKS